MTASKEPGVAPSLALVASASYKPFPSFAEWLGEPIVIPDIDVVSNIVAQLRAKLEETRQRALDVVRNVAALETGAIEDLYPSDRGLTITAATEVAILDAVTQKHNETVRAYVAAALDTYEHVLDFSTRHQPIAAAWIRQLHAEICKSQDTYKAIVGDSYEDRPLPKGAYKSAPNHVRVQGGLIHYYAPPEQTEYEMDRLVQEIRAEQFESAHPVEQTSYAHYALVAVHPFTDGNGRVARAFSSLYTYRAYSLPLLIYANQKNDYFATLAEADSGRFIPFKQFIQASVLRAARLIRQSFSTAEVPRPEDAFRSAAGMYQTSGGYLQVEVDAAAIKLVGVLQDVIQKRIQELVRNSAIPTDRKEAIVLKSQLTGGDWAASRPDHRRPIPAHAQRAVLVTGTSAPPADGAVNTIIGVSLPRDARSSDDLVLDTSPPGDSVEIPLEGFMDGDTLEANMLVTLFADRVIASLVSKVEELGRASLKKKGFGAL